MPAVEFEPDCDTHERISTRRLLLAEITRTARIVRSLCTGRALASDTRLAFSGSTYLKGEWEMNIRLSSWAVGALILATVVLMPSRSSAVFFSLGPSSNDWGVKYEVEVTASRADELNVAFTLADGGRLKPIYSVTVVAFSKLRPDGGRAYVVKAPIELKPTKDGKAAGQVKIPKEYADIATLRILTLNVDGRRQTAGAAYYDIPLKKFLDQTSVATSRQAPPSIAAPPRTKVVK
jgi:hypothetical protein